MGAFHRRVEAALGCWNPSMQHSFASSRRNKVTCSPPVTLWVGNIPPGLAEAGLRHTFQPFGDLLRVNLCRGRDRDTNFGFVTFCRRAAAAAAMEEVHERPPLFLRVNFKVEERSRAVREELEAEAEQFSSKWDFPEKREEDYDEEVAREERMVEEVERFMGGDSSLEEALEAEVKEVKIEMKEVETGTKEVEVEAGLREEGEGEELKVRCRRCGLGCSVRCSGCREVHYCGAACQRLDWPRHRGSCGGGARGAVTPAGEAEKTVEKKKDFIKEESKVPKLFIREKEAIKSVEDELESNRQHVRKEDTKEKDGPSKSGAKEEGREVEAPCGVGEELGEPGEVNVGDQSPFEGDRNSKVGTLKKEIKGVEGMKEAGQLWEDGGDTSEEGSMCVGSEPFLTMADCFDTKATEILMEKDIQAFELEEGCEVKLVSVEAATRAAVVVRSDVVGRAALQQLLAGDGMEGARAPVVGQVVAAPAPAGGYMRALVTATTAGTGRATCAALDTAGQVADHPHQALRRLPGEAVVVPRLVRRVTLAPTSATAPLHATFLLRPTLPHTSGLPEVELTLLSSAAEGSSASSYSLQGHVELVVGRVVEALVTHVESPREIYLCTDPAALDKMSTHVYSIGSSLTMDAAHRPAPGELVLARAPQDGHWYRALVDQVEAGAVTLSCPDFGFRQTVDRAEVRKVNRRLNFARQRFLAVRCVLSDWEEEGGPCTAATLRNLRQRLEVSGATIQAAVLGAREEGYVIKVPGVARREVEQVEHVEERRITESEVEELRRLRLEVARLRGST